MVKPEFLTLKIKTQTPYYVKIGGGAINLLAEETVGAQIILVVTDDTVYARYKDKIEYALKNCTAKIHFFIIEAGEKSKNKESLDKLLYALSELNPTKSDKLISIGGGTVSDITGFAAGIYKRGIPYINLPTTLLAMADASIGGKTAIDFGDVKNALGIINQPSAVLCDTDFLDGLSENALSCGMAEIIKCAVIGDKKLFYALKNKTITMIDALISAMKVKIRLVEKDERDEKERRLLNLGHTFAHAAEVRSGFSISHGEAVAFGMVCAAKFAEKTGLAIGISDEIQRALTSFGLGEKSVGNDGLVDMMMKDKKRRSEKINLVLPIKIGKCITAEYDAEKIKEALVWT